MNRRAVLALMASTAVNGVIGKARSERLIATIFALENVSDIRRLRPLLTAGP
ncbi:MAG: hypothetical protein ACRENA_08965 [Vulcanimicrobiaceae bacterium]